MRFTADASHELRTPVAAILADCQYALKKARPVERYRETIEVCHESAQHMRSLIDRLGVLAQFDARDGLADRERVALEELVEDAAGVITPVAAERGVRVEMNLAKVSVLADRLRLRQRIRSLGWGRPTAGERPRIGARARSRGAGTMSCSIPRDRPIRL